MRAKTLNFSRPVTLVGGGALSRGMLDEAMAVTGAVVAADGAADRLVELGIKPDAVIGDMDSIADLATWQRSETPVVHLADQDSTDFEKCLGALEAPFYVGAGFTGRRVDHMLAVFHAMLARPAPPVFQLGEQEAIALVPAGHDISLDLEPGAIVSLFPLLPAKGTLSRGLEWSVDGLAMAPGQQVGTSNRAVQAQVQIGFDAPGVLLLVERRFLAALIRAVGHLT